MTEHRPAVTAAEFTARYGQDASGCGKTWVRLTDLPEARSRAEAEHANICSLPFGHEGGHWWMDETWQEPPSTVTDLIHAWHAKAVGADAAADAFMVGRERPTYQVVTWRAQADIWRLCAEQLADFRAGFRAQEAKTESAQ